MSQPPGCVRPTVLASPAYRNRGGNPYNALLSESLEDAGFNVREYRSLDMLRRRGSIWLIHWPEHSLHRSSPARAVLSLMRFLLKVALARSTRTRIVWTVHNLHGHDDATYPRLNRVLRAALVRAVSGWIALSDEAASAAKRSFRQLQTKPFAVIPHGHYRGEYPAPDPRQNPRTELELPGTGPIFLFFGQVRPYKNLHGLIDAFKKLRRDDCILVIAGQADTDAAMDLRQAISGDARIVAHLGFVSNEQLPLYFQAAAVTVLPYTRFLNSGAALLSLSFDTPILAPNAGSMPSLRRAVGRPWVQMYEGDLRPADLVRALDTSRSATGPAPLHEFEWTRVGEMTADFFRHVATR